MMRLMTTLLLGLLLVVSLFAIGQWLTVTDCPPNFIVAMLAQLGISWPYLKSLGPEVGGTGIDAVLIGGTTGVIVSRLAKWRKIDDQNHAVRRRRSSGVAIDLRDELSQYSGALDLSGLNFSGATISDVDLKGTRFSVKGRQGSTLTKIVFNGCNLIGVDFRGCELENVRFKNCEMKNCDFTGAIIRVTDGTQMFDVKSLRRCRFDKVRFFTVDLENVEHRGCSFWEATFLASAQMPQDIFCNLEQRDREEVTDPSPGLKITSQKDYLSRLSIQRLLFVLRAAAALRQRIP